ncbi:relaxase/mobilization nuclease [Streptomyces sp. H34-S4]|uniref:relaxase/mobilization nuclease n=1 Tax=Streptomyces sp. H34-S4 TaxID=2996463 RepID=UPI00227170BF|nr:relaxase/mobilization nuclease [Streptomyces sp. H34-S4]MCY0933829.1 relaxase/mobilization nuclease [Streptomyces sp. H34-S4]
MIPVLHALGASSADALAKALGRPVSDQEGLTTEGTIVAHWALLDYFTDEDRIWTSAEWARHLGDAHRLHPFAATPKGDDRVILHVSVRLHPKDRELTHAEWSEVGHRLARVTGIAPPGDRNSCRWIAVRDQAHRLDLLANLIREDGVRAAVPRQVLHVVAAECRRIETDLGLLPPGDHGAGPFKAGMLPSAQPIADESASSVAANWSDEANWHLGAARRLVEGAARQLSTSPSNRPALAHQLEWIARRSHILETDLAAVASGRSYAPASGSGPRAPAAVLSPSARSR